VRRSAGGIGPATTTLTTLGRTLGFDVTTRIGEHPKVFWRTTADTGVPLKIKIEMNTHERAPALPTVERDLTVDSRWWAGAACVPTFQPAELVATKIRALYQRSKGRDLFDLWLALTRLHLAPQVIVAAFAPYRPAGLTSRHATENLRRKLDDVQFRHDLDLLVGDPPHDYDIDAAAELVADTLLAAL